MVNLYEVAKTGKDEAADADEEDEEEQLLVTVLKRVGNGLEGNSFE